MARVFTGDDVRRFQSFERSESDIAEVPDGGGDDGERSRFHVGLFFANAVSATSILTFADATELAALVFIEAADVAIFTWPTF